MVTHPSGPADAGSSLGKFTIIFEKQPPPQVRPGVKFTMPVVVKVEPREPPEPDPSLELRLSAWLKNEDGSPTDSRLLSGSFVDRVYDGNGDTMKGRVAFGDLKISRPGRYQFCVVLEITDTQQNIPVDKQQATADVIVDVNDAAPESQVPSEEDIALFVSLLNQRQPGIVPEDVQRWRDLRQ